MTKRNNLSPIPKGYALNDGQKDFFATLPSFDLVDKQYQKRIIEFFLEDRHYFVDIADLTHVFNATATQYLLFENFPEMAEYAKRGTGTGLLALKLGFKIENYVNELSAWMESLFTLSELIDIATLTHSFPSATEDQPEEWYLLGIRDPV